MDSHYCYYRACNKSVAVLISEFSTDATWQVEALHETVRKFLEFELKTKICQVGVSAEESKRGLFFNAVDSSGRAIIVKFLSNGSSDLSPEVWFYLSATGQGIPSLNAEAICSAPELIALPRVAKEDLGFYVQGQAPSPASLFKFGLKLAQLHASALCNCPHRSSPAYLQFKAPRPSAVVNLSPAAFDVLLYIQTDQFLLKSLNDLGDLTSCRQSFIHGDIKPENFFWLQAEVALLDWECSGLGDWRWDVASVIASILLKWIDAIDDTQIGKAVLVERGDQNYLQCMLLVNCFIASYEAASPSRFSHDDIRIINGYVVLWLLSRGFSMIVQQNSVTRSALNLLIVARGIAEHPLKYA